MDLNLSQRPSPAACRRHSSNNPGSRVARAAGRSSYRQTTRGWARPLLRARARRAVMSTVPASHPDAT